MFGQHAWLFGNKWTVVKHGSGSNMLVGCFPLRGRQHLARDDKKSKLEQIFEELANISAQTKNQSKKHAKLEEAFQLEPMTMTVAECFSVK